MLIGQFVEEQPLELLQCGVALPWNRNRRTLVFGGVDLYQFLEFIVVDIVCVIVVQSARM